MFGVNAPLVSVCAECDCFNMCLFAQVKNGEGLPQGPHPQRAAQPASKEQVEGEREEAESKALQAVQCSLLKILSKTLATLQHFTPDCCQILLDQVHTHTPLIHNHAEIFIHIHAYIACVF